jgi:hypothetical protein
VIISGFNFNRALRIQIAPSISGTWPGLIIYLRVKLLIINMFHGVPPVPRKNGTLEIKISTKALECPYDPL